MDFTLRSAYLFKALETYRPAISFHDDLDRLAAFYADADFRTSMKAELLDPKALNWFTDQRDKLEVVEVVKDEHCALEGRMLADLADEAGKHSLNWLLDFGAQENFETLFKAQILNADEDQVIKLLKDKNATIGLADAGDTCTCSAMLISVFICLAIAPGSGATFPSRDLGSLDLSSSRHVWHSRSRSFGGGISGRFGYI